MISTAYHNKNNAMVMEMSSESKDKTKIEIQRLKCEDFLDVVVDFNNIKGEVECQAHYMKREGISHMNGSQLDVELNPKISTHIQQALSQIDCQFKVHWTKYQGKIWNNEEEIKVDIKVPSGKCTKLSQLVGKCGPFIVRTDHYVHENYSDGQANPERNTTV